MTFRQPPRHASEPPPGRPVPSLAKLGAIVIALGLLADVVEHDFVTRVQDPPVGAFPVGEHLAHFVVLVGMVLVLVGIVADGVRLQRRPGRQQGVTRDALR